MSRFDRNDESLRQKAISENIEQAKIGRVTEVYPHGQTFDDSNFEVDVDTIGKGVGSDSEKRNESYCPVISPGGNDTIDIPKVDDKVLVMYTEEQSDRPFVMGTTFTEKDRPPLGKAGMWRRRFESGESPLGDGDIYLTGYTKYDDTPENISKYSLEPEETWFQISKHREGQNVNMGDVEEPALFEGGSSTLPFQMTLYDSPKEEESRFTIGSNQIDQDPTLKMRAKMDFKDGVIRLEAEDADNDQDWHFEMDVKNRTAEIKGDLNSDDDRTMSTTFDFKNNRTEIQGDLDNNGKQMETRFDFRNKTTEIVGDSASDNRMGASFKFDTDQFQISDGNKFGVESDGNGNFTWSHKSIDLKQEDGDTGSINL